MKNEKDLAVVSDSKSPWTAKQVALIKNTVAKGADMDELHLFLYTAKKVGLDPLAKQIYFNKFRNKDGSSTMTIITGIDGYRSIAERTGQLAGIDDAIFDDGNKNEAGKEPVNPSKATVTVYRMVSGQRVAFTASARWKEYVVGGNKGFMWTKMPYNQLAKCAEALALRKAFPNDLLSLRTDDEMAQAQDVLPVDEITETKNPKKAPKADVEVIDAEVVVKQYCGHCGVEISDAEARFSERMFKVKACRECQKGLKK